MELTEKIVLRFLIVVFGIVAALIALGVGLTLCESTKWVFCRCRGPGATQTVLRKLPSALCSNDITDANTGTVRRVSSTPAAAAASPVAAPAPAYTVDRGDLEAARPVEERGRGSPVVWWMDETYLSLA